MIIFDYIWLYSIRVWLYFHSEWIVWSWPLDFVIMHYISWPHEIYICASFEAICQVGMEPLSRHGTNYFSFATTFFTEAFAADSWNVLVLVSGIKGSLLRSWGHNERGRLQTGFNNVEAVFWLTVCTVHIYPSALWQQNLRRSVLVMTKYL